MKPDAVAMTMSVTLVALAAFLVLAPAAAAVPKTETPDIVRVLDAGTTPDAVALRRGRLLAAFLSPKQDGGFPMLDVQVLFQGTENPDVDSAVVVLRNTETGATTAQILIWREGATKWFSIPEAYR